MGRTVQYCVPVPCGIVGRRTGTAGPSPYESRTGNIRLALMRKLPIVLAAVLLMTAGCHDRQGSHGRRPARSGWITWGLPARPGSIVYPYSVIAGGVESAADVAEAAARDPETADHYSDIRVNALEAVNLKGDTSAYVSFRKDGKIYWTSQKVHLAKGERVLSDGINCVRGRCGNRISWTPRRPVLPKQFQEPTSAQLNTPAVRGQSIDELPAPPILSGFETIPAFPSIASLIAATALPPGGIAVAGGPSAGGRGGGGVGGGAPAPGGGSGSEASSATPYYGDVVPAIVVPFLPGATVPPQSVTVIQQNTSINWVAVLAETSIATPYLPGATVTPSSVSTPGAWNTTTTSVSYVETPPLVPPDVAPPSIPDVPNTPSTPVPPGTPQSPPDQPHTPCTPPQHPPCDHDASPVPEPGTMLLIGLGMIAISLRLRKRR
jgi:hypothetical protein